MRRLGGMSVLLLASVLMRFHAQAQSVVDTSSVSKWYIGVKAGFVLSTVWGPDQPTSGTLVRSLAYSLLPGVSVGVNIPIILGKHFILEPEVLFTTKGVRWEGEGQPAPTVILAHYYVEAPVLAKLVMWPSRRLKPVLYAGPQIGIAVYSYHKVRGEGMSRDWSIADSTMPFDLGLVGGIGLHIKAYRGFFIIDARGGAGILDQDSYRTVFRNIYAIGNIAYCFNPKKKRSLW